MSKAELVKNFFHSFPGTKHWNGTEIYLKEITNYDSLLKVVGYSPFGHKQSVQLELPATKALVLSQGLNETRDWSVFPA